MSTSHLAEQAKQIDTPNVQERKPIQVSKAALIEEQNKIYLPFISDESRAGSLNQGAGMEGQTQGALKDYDPQLDRGALTGQDQYDVRSRNQSNAAKLASGGVKFLTEITLGTVSASALMLDFGMHMRAFQGVETEFSNGISRTMDEMKEGLNEKYGKVYVKKENEGFSPFTVDFWADNMETIGTTLTLMIPSMAITKGLSVAGKALKLSRASKAIRMGKAGKQITKGMSSAVISRLGENAMEASEVTKEMRGQLEVELAGKINPETDQEYTKEDITKMAAEAGRTTWNNNWWMLLQDVYQYSKAFKGLNYAKKNASDAIKKSMLSRSLKSTASFAAFDMGSESLEEGFQYIVSNESQHNVLDKAGLKGKSDFLSRLSEYVTDDEFKTSVFMGAIGGGVFAGAGKINSNIEVKREKKELEAFRNNYQTYYESVFGSAESFAQSETSGLISSAMVKSELGRLDELEADLATLEGESDEVLESQGVDPVRYREKIKEAQVLVKNVEREFNSVKSDSSIPDDLKQATIYSRMDRLASENFIKEIRKPQNQLFEILEADLSEREASTAKQMVDLKKAILSKNTKKSDRLRKEILESSKEYTSNKDIDDALSSAADSIQVTISQSVAVFQERIEAAKKFEEDLKTEKGQDSIREESKKIVDALQKEKDKIKDIQTKRAEANKANEDAEVADIKARQAKGDNISDDEAERVEESEMSIEDSNEGYIFDEEKLSKEQKKYKKERDKASEEFGEHTTPEPDGDNTFSTVNSKHHRTWIKGEKVRDSKGNEWTVSSPVGTKSGVFLTRDNAKAGETSKGTIWKIEKEFGPMSHESKKPNIKGWSVNKYKKDSSKKQTLKDIESEAAATGDTMDRSSTGEIYTGGQEFNNFGVVRTLPDGTKVYGFRGSEAIPSTSGWFPIDYEDAAKPFKGDEPVRVVVDNTKGVPVLLVKKGDVNVSQIFPAGKEKYFDAMVSVINAMGGSVDASVIGKHTTSTGNLGTIKDSKGNISHIDAQYLPNGKIYLGSRKKNDPSERNGVIEFYSSDGDMLDFNISEKKIEKGVYDGHTYMLIETPSGDRIPIQLNESTLSEIISTDSQGVSGPLNETIYSDLENAALDIETEFNEYVAKLMEDGASKEKAFLTAKQFFGFEHVEGNVGESKIRSAVNGIIDGRVTQVHDVPVTDAEGNVTYHPGKNYLRIRMVLAESSGTVTGYIGVIVTTAIPHASEEGAYVKKIAVSREAAIEALGGRFASMSLDHMRGSKGGAYVANAIEQQWITTDLNVNRPWVNTRLKIKFNPKTTQDIKEVMREADSTGTKSTAESAQLSDVTNKIAEEFVKVEDDIFDVTDFWTEVGLNATPERFTLKQFWNKNFKDQISYDKFEDSFNISFKEALGKVGKLSVNDISRLKREVLKTYSKQLLTNKYSVVKVSSNSPTTAASAVQKAATITPKDRSVSGGTTSGSTGSAQSIVMKKYTTITLTENIIKSRIKKNPEYIKLVAKLKAERDAAARQKIVDKMDAIEKSVESNLEVEQEGAGIQFVTAKKFEALLKEAEKAATITATSAKPATPAKSATSSKSVIPVGSVVEFEINRDTPPESKVKSPDNSEKIKSTKPDESVSASPGLIGGLQTAKNPKVDRRHAAKPAVEGPTHNEGEESTQALNNMLENNTENVANLGASLTSEAVTEAQKRNKDGSLKINC